MRALAALLLGLALAACSAGGDAAGAAAAAAAAAAVPLDGTRWRLASGLPGVDAAAVEVTLSFAEGRISGNGGCNQYSAELTRNGEAVELGPVVATKRGCLGPGSAAEVAYFAALEQVDALRREGGELLLRGEGVELHFVPLE